LVYNGQPTTLPAVSLNTPVAGNVGMDGNVAVGPTDVDLYKFTATATQSLAITTDTTQEGSAATFLRFFDASGHELAYSGDSATDTNNSLTVPVTAGQSYYIGVDGA